MKLAVLTPVFNDWDSFYQLVRELQDLTDHPISTIVVVDDASYLTLNPDSLPEAHPPIHHVQLVTNVGHQRAIAIGMALIESNPDIQYDALVVMDSDGEDRVPDIPLLIKAYHDHNKSKAVFARRAKRSENLRFRILYQVYKLLFSLLTGQKISFGNFSCLPESMVKKLIYHPDLWNHYSACVLKSGMPFTTVDTERGVRYSGNSKMNVQNLILHGFSSIAVYLDEMSIRLLGLSLTGIIIAGSLLIMTIFIRLCTDLAIPGWATYVSMILINIISMMFVVSLLGLLIRLNNRNQLQDPLPKVFSSYIKNEKYHPKG